MSTKTYSNIILSNVISKSARTATIITSTKHCSETCIHCNKTRKKSYKDQKERKKLFLFADDMIIYIKKLNL